MKTPPKKTLHPATIAAQAAGATDRATGGVVPPVHLATTYLRDQGNQLVNPQNTYLRDNNDTLRAAEQLLCQLDGAQEALLLPSGMAAVAAIFRTLPNRASVLVQSQIYHGTTKWIEGFCSRREIALHQVQCGDTQALAKACAELKPALVWIETPSNPWLRITDIAKVAQAAHEVGALLAVDNTAATPALCQPLSLGADIVMQSATKGMNGHSDVLAGALSTNVPNSNTWQMICEDRATAGAMLGPFEAWLLMRGMRTMPLRMERVSETAQTLAEYLANHPQVEHVFYPGLPDHPSHDCAKKQMPNGFGGLLSIVVKGGSDAALRCSGRLALFQRATSLGGVESLVEHRHTIEPHTGIPEGLLRLSVGLEHPQDLIDDLDQALGQ